MLKPQAIKDQEFQIKFRGYDPIEVRNYLELLAEDFFELSERNRVLKEQLDTLEYNAPASRVEMDMSVGTLESLEGVEDVQLEIEKEDRVRVEKQRELEAKLAHAESRMEALSTENMGYLSQVGDLNKQLEEIETESASQLKERQKLLNKITDLTQENLDLKQKSHEIVKDTAEVERLKGEVDRLQAENKELRKEEAGFKKAVLVAQAFADNLKQSAETEAANIVGNAKAAADQCALDAENLKKSATEEAGKIVEDAKASADKYAQDLHDKVAHLPKQIEELEGRKELVRDDLRNVLHGYLSALDLEKQSGNSID